jgi:hypothetical protein
LDTVISFFKNAAVFACKWIEDHSDFVTAAASATIALFTLTLWWATRKLWKVSQEQSRDMKESLRIAQEAADAAKDSAQVAKTTLTSTQRAFVFLKDIKFKEIRGRGYTSMGGNYEITWLFFPCWANSGDTPTRNLTINIGY